MFSGDGRASLLRRHRGRHAVHSDECSGISSALRSDNVARSGMSSAVSNNDVDQSSIVSALRSDGEQRGSLSDGSNDGLLPTSWAGINDTSLGTTPSSEKMTTPGCHRSSSSTGNSATSTVQRVSNPSILLR